MRILVKLYIEFLSASIHQNFAFPFLNIITKYNCTDVGLQGNFQHKLLQFLDPPNTTSNFLTRVIRMNFCGNQYDQYD